MNLLIQCIKNQHPDLARKMIRLALPCQLDAQDEQGYSALHWAVELCNIEIIKALLNKGASANLSNKQGLTPLHLATQLGAQPIAQQLVAHGADPHAYDKYYKTPWILASENGHKQIADWLKALPKVIAQSNLSKSSFQELIQFKMLEMMNSTPENQKTRQQFLANSRKENLAFVYPNHPKKRSIR